MRLVYELSAPQRPGGETLKCTGDRDLGSHVVSMVAIIG